MCMFTGKARVSSTRIFARVQGGEQFLAYEASVKAYSDLAMVLPIPVCKGTAESDVVFGDLSGYEAFFGDLDKPWIVYSKGISRDFKMPMSMLKVHDVGKYEASFVPSQGDFSRLDPRFALSEGVLSKLPEYSDYGFVVVKMKKGENKPHAVFARFPTRDPSVIFFPTVHVHDGVVEAVADDFDHELYTQGGKHGNTSWHGEDVWFTRNIEPAWRHVQVEKTAGLILSKSAVSKAHVSGRHVNRDIVVKVEKD